MKCPNCTPQRLRCIFTCPIGSHARYRVYRCGFCQVHIETTEDIVNTLHPKRIAKKGRAARRSVYRAIAAKDGNFQSQGG